MDSIRWGIVGAGSIADLMASDFEHVPGADLRAVAARDADRAREFARKHGVPASYGHYLDLIEDPDIDIVYVATTHPHHRDVALAAIDAGKAVMVEKAFAATADGARQVADAARDKGVFCMEAMWTRFLPAVQAAREVVAWGRIGTVRGISGDLCSYRRFSPSDRFFNPETGGGALLDLGVYAVSFAQAFLGTATEIHCTGRLAPNGVDMAASMALRYEAGEQAALTCALDVHGPAHLAIHGTKGWIEVGPRFHHPSSISIHRAGVLPTVIEAPMTGRGYVHEIADATRCVRAGETESPIMPLDDTVEVMRVLDECLTQVGVTQSDADLSEALSR